MKIWLQRHFRWHPLYQHGLLFLTLAVLLLSALAGCGPDLAAVFASDALDVNGIAMVNSTDGWAVAILPSRQTSVVLRYQQGIWQLANPQPPLGQGDELRAVAVAGGQVWVAGEVNTSGHGENTSTTGIIDRFDGTQWLQASVGQRVNALAMVSADNGWAVGMEGALYHYTNGSWHGVPDPLNMDLYAVAMVDANDGWAAGDLGTILRYQHGAWTPYPHMVSAQLLAMSFASPHDGWIVGEDGITLHYTRDFTGHETWIDTATQATHTLRAVSVTNAGVGWAVGDDGLIVQYQNGLWQTVSSPVSSQLNAISAVNVSDAWAGGDMSSYSLLHATASGWQSVSFKMP
jgi:hypothetical protein